MKDILRQNILAEVIRIGDELLSVAEQDRNGLSWKTPIPGPDDSPVWTKDEGIYSGTSGIALYLMELHRQTKDEKYLYAATEGMRWVGQYCEDNPTQYYALFTGRMGVVYAMIRIAEITGRTNYLEQALRIAKPCDSFLNLSPNVDDLLNGTSGTLLGLLHLHAVTGERWILDKINLFTGHLMHSTHTGPKGLYWDGNEQQIHSLCGFSHGAAGLGFVFLELGHYFGKNSFYWMAEQAFAYEAYYYDSKIMNWPDFRIILFRPIDYQKYEQAYLDGDLGIFTEISYSNAWCHGAAGIGLARLRAWELLKKHRYKDEIQIAVEKTKYTDLDSADQAHPLHILCHGKGGNAELFLEAYRLFRNEPYMDLAYSMAERTLSFRNTMGRYLSERTHLGAEQNHSLFTGTAGIGYFLLHCLDPLNLPSILIPKVTASIDPNTDLSSYSFIGISPANTHKLVLERSFKRTLLTAQVLAPQATGNWLDIVPSSECSIAGHIAQFIEGILPALPERDRALMNDVFFLELSITKIEGALSSNALLYIKERVKHAKTTELLQLNHEAFLNQRLILDPDIIIHTCSWLWNEITNIDDSKQKLKDEAKVHHILLIPYINKVTELTLSPFSHAVISSFKSGASVNLAISNIMRNFDSITMNQEKQIQSAIIEQIKQAILSGILVNG